MTPAERRALRQCIENGFGLAIWDTQKPFNWIPAMTKLLDALDAAEAHVEIARADASAWACAVIAAEEKAPGIVKLICETHDRIVMRKL